MADETAICNLALGRIGSVRILALDDSTQEARFSKLFYAETRDEVLRDHPWNFAQKRAVLSALSDAPLFGWRWAYALPVDCLRVLQLNGFAQDAEPDEWEIEDGKLMTDAGVAQVTYTARVDDAVKFDALFVEALSVKLAAKLVTPLTGSRTQAADFVKEYEGIISGRAKRRDSAESRSRQRPMWTESALVRSRLGGAGSFFL